MAKTSDIGEDGPIQPSLDTYPLSTFGNQKRAFNRMWYQNRPWLEYSISKDAIFCYPCRKYAASSKGAFKDDTFTVKGFRNWKAAVEKDRGIIKHEKSQAHMTAVATWVERQKRIDSGKSIDRQLVCHQLERNLYYLNAIYDDIKFLVLNELPLRGDNENLESHTAGKFLNLFQFMCERDPKLKEISLTIPENASYLTHESQNEVISILAQLVQKGVADEARSSDGQCISIFCDGTRDKNNDEQLAVAVRYVKGVPYERLLSVSSLTALDADAIAQELIQVLRNSDLLPDTTSTVPPPVRIISQCYDGARVMAGRRGGVQKKIQEVLNYDVPYVHCFNHQLHLVLAHVMSSEAVIRQYFEIAGALYNFTRRYQIATAYTGDTLKRLLEHRWTGHLAATSIIVNNFMEIQEVLSDASESESMPEDIVTQATGLLGRIRRPEFLLVANVVNTILELAAPANRFLQSVHTDILTAIDLINSVQLSLNEIRTSEYFETILRKCSIPEGDDFEEEQPSSKRRRIESSRYYNLPCITCFPMLAIYFSHLYSDFLIP
jgi:hypothetical protein